MAAPPFFDSSIVGSSKVVVPAAITVLISCDNDLLCPARVRREIARTRYLLYLLYGYFKELVYAAFSY